MSHRLCPLKLAALDAPHQKAFVSREESLTFSQLDQQTDLMANQLHGSGIKEGSLIAVRLPTSSSLLSLFFAAWRLGASLCPLNLRLPAAQIDTHLKRLSTQLFISSLPLNPPKTTYTPFVTQSLFLFTSGSTATPKIAVLSLDNLIANAMSAIETFDLRPNDRWLLSLPLYHVGGIGIMLRSILARATMVLDEKDPEITHLSYVPTQLYRATPIYQKLRCLLLGGAPIHDYPSQLPCFISYGLTEMGSVVAASYKPLDLSVGDVLKNREISITDDGEIMVRGPCLFQGYWKEGRLEKPFDEKGWFKTGDLGSYCSMNRLRVTGRKDWQFISGGENIQPEEIENELMQLATVLEAVVIGKPDAEFGQIPIALIKSSDPHLTVSQIQKILSEKLPKYKIPKKIFLIDEMPKVGMKIDRSQLKRS